MDNTDFFLIGFIVASGLILTILIITDNINNKNNNICYDMAGLNEILETINKNCGSLLFTKPHGSEEWTVFKSNVCDGKKCEHKYLPVKECLTNG